MAKKIDCDKFLVIEVSGNECLSFGGMAICDFCNNTAAKGYYIAVINSWYCPECFEAWKKRAHWYQQDALIEMRNFKTYAKILGIDSTVLNR